MKLESKRARRLSHLMGIGLVLGFVLPHTSTVFLMVNPILCLLFWLLRRRKRIWGAALLVFVSLSISILANMTQVASMKPLLTCVTIMMYSVCFPFADAEIRVRPVYFYVTLVCIVLTQVAYLLDVSFVTNLLDTYYPIEGDLENVYLNMQRNITYENMLSYRLGGLYRNPNQCARSLTLLLAAFLLLYKERNIWWFAVLAFAGIVLTGSRTGFIIASLIIVTYIIVCIKTSSPVKISIGIAAAVGIAYMMLAGPGIFRAVDIAAGMSGSSGLKFEAFSYYIQNEQSSIRLLFGYLDPDRFQSTSGVLDYFDADYGYLIFNYGIVGFAMILLFNLFLFNKTDREGRVYFIVLLWMITSSIYSSFRALFVYMLLLSLVYNRFRKSSLNKEKHSV